MTCRAPTCDRILPCLTLVAFAQISGTPTSVSVSTVRTLASRCVPMPTTARGKSWTPSWRNVSVSVASACTTWVRRSDQSCTMSSSVSMPRTSWPRLISDSATCPPKRPSPTTTTLSSFGVLRFSANEWSLLGIAVEPAAGVEGDRGAYRDRADPADVHQDDQHGLRGRRQGGRDAGAQPDRRERLGHLEQRAVERHVVGQRDQPERAGGDQRHPGQRDREGLPLRLVG